MREFAKVFTRMPKSATARAAGDADDAEEEDEDDDARGLALEHAEVDDDDGRR